MTNFFRKGFKENTLKIFLSTVLGVEIFVFSCFTNLVFVQAQALTFDPLSSSQRQNSSSQSPANTEENILPSAPLQTQNTSYQKTFIVSAYYSPQKGQQRYITGSYQGDLRLNGNGVHGADGSEVYPGMIAAPKGYDFGTKMNIPGIGTVAVHDRGGAIVHAGERQQAYDRLDVWMGSGDDGLGKALVWGKRTVNVTVYGIDPQIQELVNFDAYNKVLQPAAPPKETQLFSIDLKLGNQGDEVGVLQNSLKTLGYYQEEMNKNYDEKTQNAVTQFQIDANIIDDQHDFGAGYFGPQTRIALEAELKKHSDGTTQSAVNGTKTVSTQSPSVPSNNVIFNRDLELGDHGDDVQKLQEELQKMHLLAVPVSGYYGEVTQHAVFKFQQNLGLVGDTSSAGAGRLGSITRTHLNTLVQQRQQTEKLIADKKKDDDELK